MADAATLLSMHVTRKNEAGAAPRQHSPMAMMPEAVYIQRFAAQQTVAHPHR